MSFLTSGDTLPLLRLRDCAPGRQGQTVPDSLRILYPESHDFQGPLGSTQPVGVETSPVSLMFDRVFSTVKSLTTPYTFSLTPIFKVLSLTFRGTRGWWEEGVRTGTDSTPNVPTPTTRSPT